MALLHRLLSLRDSLGIEVCAAHFEHGLRGEESLRDAAFVETWCREHGVPCAVEHGDVRAAAGERHLGPEEAARTLRYAFLERTADAMNCAWIATAHNADDNAETVLLHLLRGSGAVGLGGIPRRRGRIVRPLLDTPRSAIERYLREQGVPHVEDSSNGSDAYTRNFLRHRVTPLLRELNPAFTEALGRTARLLTQDEAVLSELAEERLNAAFDGRSLPCAALLEAPPAIASRMLRLLWPQSLSEKQTEAALTFSRGTERGFLDLPGGRLRRERGRLWIGEEEDVPELPARELIPGESLHLPEAGLSLLSVIAVKEEEIYDLFKTCCFKYANICGKITVTGPRPGDRFHPVGRGCGKSLKALFAETGLTRRQRLLTPVIRDERGILAVYGLGQDERVSAEKGERVLRIIWTEETV